MTLTDYPDWYPDWLKCPDGLPKMVWYKTLSKIHDLIGDRLTPLDMAALEMCVLLIKIYTLIIRANKARPELADLAAEKSDFREQLESWLAEFGGPIWAADFIREIEADLNNDLVITDTSEAITQKIVKDHFQLQRQLVHLAVRLKRVFQSDSDRSRRLSKPCKFKH